MLPSVLPVRRNLAAAAVVVTSLALAGCGSDAPSSGGAIDTGWFGSTGPQDVLAAASAAMDPPASVRLQQRARNDGNVLVKDLLVAADGDCTGRLQLPSWGKPADLVVLDGQGAFRGSRAFWLTIELDLGDDEDVAAELRTGLADAYADRWTTTPGLADLCDVDDFLRPARKAATDDDLAKDGLGDVDGEPAGRLVSERDGTTTTLFVALAEPHRVLRIEVGQAGGDGSDGQVAEDGDSVTTFSAVTSPIEVDYPSADDLVVFEPPDVDQTDDQADDQADEQTDDQTDEPVE